MTVWSTAREPTCNSCSARSPEQDSRGVPQVLGYNKTIAKPEAVVAAVVDDDPFIAFGEYGRERAL